MRQQEIIQELSTVLQGLGYKIRKGKGPFRGSACTVHSERLIVLNSSAPAESKISVLASAILETNGAELHVKPAVKALLVKEEQRRQSAIDLQTPVFEADGLAPDIETKLAGRTIRDILDRPVKVKGRRA